MSLQCLKYQQHLERKQDLKFPSTVAIAEPGQLARKRPLVANFSFVEYTSEDISRMHASPSCLTMASCLLPEELAQSDPESHRSLVNNLLRGVIEKETHEF